MSAADPAGDYPALAEAVPRRRLRAGRSGEIFRPSVVFAAGLAAWEAVVRIRGLPP